MRACARANGTVRCRLRAACGITPAPPPSTDPCASRRSVTPISRGHANALGFQHPGAFSFWRSHKGTTHDQTRLHRAPEASGHCWPEAGKPAKAHGCAVPGCFGTGGKRMQSHEDWRFRCHVGSANAEHRSNGPQRRRLRAVKAWPARCARRCRGVCRGSGEGVPQADGSSEVEQRRKPLATGSNPVRPPLDSSDG